MAHECIDRHVDEGKGKKLPYIIKMINVKKVILLTI